MSNGIWNQWQADTYHQSSPKLAAWLAKYLPKHVGVIDFGCGTGYYCGELVKQGFEAFGVEGTMLNNFQCHVEIHDLTKPIDLGRGGSVLSLEVGEHLPKEAEQTFLDTITSHCNGELILSWALPGQPGVGHINCQPQEYIIDELLKRGFSYCPLVTMAAREHIDDNCDWFRRTLMVFTKTLTVA